MWDANESANAIDEGKELSYKDTNAQNSSNTMT